MLKASLIQRITQKGWIQKYEKQMIFLQTTESIA